LSGGEQQMLAIGRALMGAPQLLLLDEPSLGLSPLITSQVFAALSQLNAGGLTILLVEQNAKRALEVTRRAYVVEHGRIAYQGASDALMSDPRVVAHYLGGAVAAE
jgi:branched-chain amino acid transport system ATP-binding protein